MDFRSQESTEKSLVGPWCFAFTPQANFSTHNLNFHWRWWDQIQAIFLNCFYFSLEEEELEFSWTDKTKNCIGKGSVKSVQKVLVSNV